MKEQFLSKWSSWWILKKDAKQLNEAFEKELNALIEHETALRQPHVSERYDLKVGYKNKNGNMKEVVISAENCDEAYNIFKQRFGNIKVEYID